MVGRVVAGWVVDAVDDAHGVGFLAVYWLFVGCVLVGGGLMCSRGQLMIAEVGE